MDPLAGKPVRQIDIGPAGAPTTAGQAEAVASQSRPATAARAGVPETALGARTATAAPAGGAPKGNALERAGLLDGADADLPPDPFDAMLADLMAPPKDTKGSGGGGAAAGLGFADADLPQEMLGAVNVAEEASKLAKKLLPTANPTAGKAIFNKLQSLYPLDGMLTAPREPSQTKVAVPGAGIREVPLEPVLRAFDDFAAKKQVQSQASCWKAIKAFEKNPRVGAAIQFINTFIDPSRRAQDVKAAAGASYRAAETPNIPSSLMNRLKAQRAILETFRAEGGPADQVQQRGDRLLERGAENIFSDVRKELEGMLRDDCLVPFMKAVGEQLQRTSN